MKFRLSIIILLLVQSITISFGQSNRIEPVKWTFSAEKTGDETYTLSFVATIDDEWHVYSQYLKEGGPIPTSITFDNAAEFTPVGKMNEEGDKHEGYNKLFDMDVIDYSHKMTITQNVKLSQNVSEIMGYVTFMTCNGETCLPPNDIPFIIQLN